MLKSCKCMPSFQSEFVVILIPGHFQLEATRQWRKLLKAKIPIC